MYEILKEENCVQIIHSNTPVNRRVRTKAVIGVDLSVSRIMPSIPFTKTNIPIMIYIAYVPFWVCLYIFVYIIFMQNYIATRHRKQSRLEKESGM